MAANNDMESLVQRARDEAAGIDDKQALANARARYLGKKGEVTLLFSSMRDIAPEGRKEFGQRINAVKNEIEGIFAEASERIESAELEDRLSRERIDVTLPGHGPRPGTVHPYTRVVNMLTDFFVGLGYRVKDGPEVESDYFNFECLNIPADHPARDMQDSFFIGDGLLLRSHTSPVQARTMQDKSESLPLKIICPGKVYRRDNDATHSHQFGQVEGLCVGEGVTLAQLEKTLVDMFEHVFGPGSKARFRPSFFPFTEPSIECDVSCFECRGKGCSLCKGTGWIEVLGAGMVNPDVFRLNGIDPDRYSGFAFGIGIDRVAMLLYGIDDIHRFYQDDVAFLEQFDRR